MIFLLRTYSALVDRDRIRRLREPGSLTDVSDVKRYRVWRSVLAVTAHDSTHEAGCAGSEQRLVVDHWRWRRNDATWRAAEH